MQQAALRLITGVHGDVIEVLSTLSRALPGSPSLAKLPLPPRQESSRVSSFDWAPYWPHRALTAWARKPLRPGSPGHW